MYEKIIVACVLAIKLCECLKEIYPDYKDSIIEDIENLDIDSLNNKIEICQAANEFEIGE